MATSIRGILRAIQLLSNSGRTLIELLLRVFPTAQLGLWIIVGADLVRARIWEHAADQGVWMRVLNPYVDIVAAPSTAGCRWTRLLSRFRECLRSSPWALQGLLSRSEPRCQGSGTVENT